MEQLRGGGTNRRSTYIEAIVEANQSPWNHPHLAPPLVSCHYEELYYIGICHGPKGVGAWTGDWRRTKDPAHLVRPQRS